MTSISARCLIRRLQLKPRPEFRRHNHSFSDPNRPDLFYHLLPTSPPTFALSFLPTPPPRPRSATILGWLPAAAGEDAGLNDFSENPAFRPVLHSALRSALRDGADDVQAAAATQLHAGWLHIHDERNVPALGRIGDPDDIVATVLVEDGKILPETYQPMPAYRLCTADGVVHLTSGLTVRLRQVLEEHAKGETEAGG
jgi:hypothetical protein